MIIYVSNENSTIVDEESTIHGVPDLLIEILSPGNRNYDLEIKKNLYEKFGVKEYWAIDPLTKEVLGYFLIDGKYLDAEMLKGKIASKLLSKTFIF
jgi:Uma2 family endonuclease